MLKNLINSIIRLYWEIHEKYYSWKCYRGYTYEDAKRDLQMQSIEEVIAYYRSQMTFPEYKQHISFRDFVEDNLDHIEMQGDNYVAVAYIEEDEPELKGEYVRYEYVYDDIFDFLV